MSSQYEALRHVYRYPGFTESELSKLFAAHEKVSFEKGKLFLKEGRIPNEYFILESGLARSYVIDYDGNDITTNFFTPNQVVIEVSSLFQRIKSKENIEAIMDCECWKIDFNTFQELYHSIKSFNEWGRAWMSGKLFELKQRSVEMITENATDRYLKLMNERPAIFQYAPLKCIATYLGITDTSLSRIRKEIKM